MYRASIENLGDSKYYATTKDYSFVLGTEGQGANPVDTLLASLCGCIGHYVRDYLRDQRIDYRGFMVAAEAALTADKARLSAIDLWIDLKDIALDKSRGAELLAYVERCKVHSTLKECCLVRVSLGHRERSDAQPLKTSHG